MGETTKKWKEPLADFWNSADQLFNAISACHYGNCSIHPELEVRVLSTYLGRSESTDGFNMEVLCSLDPNNEDWAEIEVLAHESSTAVGPRVRLEDRIINCRPKWYIENPNITQFICQTICTRQIAHVFRFNFVLDGEKLWQHRTSDRLSSSTDQTESVTLHQLLSDGVSEWTAVQKLVLSLILAYSLFYFYGGPWLGGRWSRHNILFFSRAGSIPLQPLLRFCRNKDHFEGGSVSQNGLLHRYPSLLEFAVALLEIDLGHSLESFPSRIEEIASLDDQYAKACEVFKIRKQYILSKYYRQAISACLYEDFSRAENDGAEQFRYQIYGAIVRPLEQELHNSCQEFISLESLDSKAPSMNLGLTPVFHGNGQNGNTSGLRIRHDSSRQILGTHNGVEASIGRQRQTHGDRLSMPSHTSSMDVNRPHISSVQTPLLQPLSGPSSKSINPRPSHRSEFEIGVICALRTEYDAVALLFDEYWDDEGELYGRAPGDENTYLTGRIGKYTVVLVLLPGMGKVNAARAASTFRASYTGIRLALLVGICGGVPKDNEGREILLGDVVIGTQIIEYDLVRMFPDQLRKHNIADNRGRGNINVQSFLSTLQTKHHSQRLENRTAHYLSTLQRKVKTTEYQYPTVVKDRLFQSTYRHKHHLKGQCDICTRCRLKSDPVCEDALSASCRTLLCDDKYLVPRDRLRKRKFGSKEVQNPVIHFGPIASGDSVMRSGEDRDRISRMEKAIAFEMEGSGVWDSLPCILIKGVCDYADSHKNKDWQNFACATAASAMKAVLERYVQLDK